MTLIWRKLRLWLLCVCDVFPVFLQHTFSPRDHPAIALDKIAGFKTGRRTGQMQRTHFPMGTYKENLSGNHHTDTDKHPHSSWFSLDFGVQFAIQGKSSWNAVIKYWWCHVYGGWPPAPFLLPPGSWITVFVVTGTISSEKGHAGGRRLLFLGSNRQWIIAPFVHI